MLRKRRHFFPVLLQRKWCKVRAFVQNCYSVISEKALVSDLKVDLISKKPYFFSNIKSVLINMLFLPISISFHMLRILCYNKIIISSFAQVSKNSTGSAMPYVR